MPLWGAGWGSGGGSGCRVPVPCPLRITGSRSGVEVYLFGPCKRLIFLGSLRFHLSGQCFACFDLEAFSHGECFGSSRRNSVSLSAPTSVLPPLPIHSFRSLSSHCCLPPSSSSFHPPLPLPLPLPCFLSPFEVFLFYGILNIFLKYLHFPSDSLEQFT